MVEVLDDNYLALTALVTVGFQLAFFFVAYTCQFDKVTDFSGASNFLLVFLLTYFLGETYTTRQTVVTILASIWAIRLGAFLLYRVLQRGKDDRFDEMREHFFRFLGFWIFQMIWVWTVSLSVTFLNSAPKDVSLNARDYVGWTFWGIGFFYESVADFSKSWFRNSPNKTKEFLDEGVWRNTRHPNYFGEIMMWLGLFLSASSVFDENTKAGYVSVLSPVLTFVLLMFLSGVPMAEASYDKRFKDNSDYWTYKQRTSPLIPLPRTLYGNLPYLVKAFFFCEFPMYNRNNPNV